MIRLAKTIWYVLTLRCEEADRLRAAPERNGQAQRIADRLHRLLCKSCRRAKRQAEMLRVAFEDLGELERGPSLDEAARARIAAAIAAEHPNSPDRAR